ncbi:phosphotransferase [Paracoccus fistulariae]|uniref:Cold shock domain-containing protein n=1 Tax=Paracoccus fistulariae TaxID=658446 RepID=A0ABY7SLC3_9RHOB|nr:phosphotransferase [Paracoccus fistulariae]MDB6182486.1 phosphotransferase [Paracoccus fistulariae]WCR07705.1 cold shock domain-containing protein [Paracoccus fistulariae]
MISIEGLEANDPRRVSIEEALDQWIAGADVHLDAIPGGFSGSAVFKLDVRKAPKDTIKSGVYILKISEAPKYQDQKPEQSSHEVAYNRAPAFSEEHIPQLRYSYRSERDSHYDVMVFDIAGRSLNRYTASVGKHANLIFDNADGIVSNLLSAWADEEFQPRSSAHEVLKNACGYRSDHTKASELHDFINSFCGGEIFPMAGEILVNPLHFLDLLSQNDKESLSPLTGLSHGDLHGGNILFHRFNPESNPYFIIDFALSSENLVGFDLAYLELSFALSFLGANGASPLIAVLNALDPDNTTAVVPPNAMWIEKLFTKLRLPLETFLSSRFPARQDDFEKQILLSRVAAGINWANKPIDRSLKISALAYAGWAARRYLEVFLDEEWARLSRLELSESESNSSSDALWQQLFREAGSFTQSDGLFVLVTEGQHPDPHLKALGHLPWSAVIDLDPNSDENGLYRFSSDVLAAKRSLHLFTSNIPEFDPRRSTAWMLAAGWSTRKEFFPDFHKWRWDRLPIVRQLVKKIAEKTNPTPIYCLILPGLTLDKNNPSSRIESIIRDIDEATRGRAKIFVLGGRAINESATNLFTVPLSVGDFVRHAANTFGTTVEAEGCKIPGPSGEYRTVLPEKIRALEENLSVLHSEVLKDFLSDADNSSSSDFWRGRPPTWEEISADVDIRRDANEALISECRKWLSSHRNHTIVVEHQPGSGATTLAMRVAWELHYEHPTAYVESFSPSLGERIRELFLISERPVFVVADSSVLTESNREDVQRYLAQNNCRAVLLYLRRSFFPSKKRSFEIIEGLTPREVKKFKSTYMSLTEDSRKREQISKVSTNETLKKYRLPFFYGLIAFERDFLGVDSYVKHHIAGASRDIRRVLEHIAVVTIFSNGTIPESIIYSISGVEPDSNLELRDLFGDGVANLILSYGGGVRIMHQILAEEVLEHFRLGLQDDWRLDLKSYSIDLISDLVKAAGPSACVDLFRQLFIDRSGSTDGVEDREDFAPIIENLDAIDVSLGHSVLQHLCDNCPDESHFWSHLGRHQVYRMRRDFEKAEEYLHRAISLSSNDAVHYHTLGLIIRSRLRHNLKSLPRVSSLDDVFQALDPLYSEAESAFQEARRLSPDNVYGYITNIQLITASIARLKVAAAVESVSMISSESSEVALWLEEKLSEAEELLRGATNLYSTLEPTNDYLVECEAELDRLYGDLDGVVERWELANASGKGANTRSRNALANAYLVRGERKWSNLSASEKRRIAELSATNLREAGRRSDDYSLWFHAFSGLPEFDFDEAVSQITLWSRRFPSWEAHYFLYILHFLLWFGQRTNDLDSYRESLRRCQELSFARKSRSPVWFGRSGSECRIVSELDLGGWDRGHNFFSNEEPLIRINGVIDSINGPTSGTIVIDGKFSVFFSPGRDYAQYRSLNERVNFYLGFSPTGPRAWRIETGFVEGGNRSKEPVAAEGSVLVDPSDEEASRDTQLEVVSKLNFDRILRFALEFSQAKARLGARVELESLLERLDAVHRMGALFSQSIDVATLLEGLKSYGVSNYKGQDGRIILNVSFENSETDTVSVAVSEKRIFGKVTHVPDGERYGFIQDRDENEYFFHFNSVLPAFRREIHGEGEIVSFVPALGEKGPTAQGITLHKETVVSSSGCISADRFSDAFCEYVFERIDDSGGVAIDLGQLIDTAKAEFLSTRPLEQLLSTKSLGSFINGIEGIAVFGRPPNLLVGRSHHPFIGRLPADDGRADADRPGSKSAGEGKVALNKSSFKAWLSDELSEEPAASEGMPFTSLGTRAKAHFVVKGKVPQSLGFTSYAEMISALGGFRIEGPDHQQRVFRDPDSSITPDSN